MRRPSSRVLERRMLICLYATCLLLFFVVVPSWTYWMMTNTSTPTTTTKNNNKELLPPIDAILPRGHDPTREQHPEYMNPQVDIPDPPGISYSQWKQDHLLWGYFFSDYPTAQFVEIGAADGVFSNTRMFAEKLGWQGLLVEPSPVQFKDLLAGPQCKLPHVQCVNQAVCHDGQTTVTIGGFGMTGKVMANDARITRRDAYTIKCSRMDTLVNDAHISRIDLFSIDVEGSELIALETFDFTRIPVFIIVIENMVRNNFFSPDIAAENYQKYVILLRNGFKFVTRIHGVDEVWINPANDLRTLRKLYQHND